MKVSFYFFVITLLLHAYACQRPAEEQPDLTTPIIGEHEGYIVAYEAEGPQPEERHCTITISKIDDHTISLDLLTDDDYPEISADVSELEGDIILTVLEKNTGPILIEGRSIVSSRSYNGFFKKDIHKLDLYFRMTVDNKLYYVSFNGYSPK